MLVSPRRLLAISLASTGLMTSADAITASNAEAAFGALQQWYDPSIGLWIPNTGWWSLTVIADLAAIDTTVRIKSIPLFANTYARAQKYNLQMQKNVGTNWLPETFYGHHWPFFPPGWPIPSPIRTNGFLNDYYDDEGWWALAWIAAYDITMDRAYLSTAKSIFEDMKAAYGTTPCGGIWWDKANTYVNAIANELFLDVAAHLANRATEKSYYLSWAKKQWAWFQKSGMINAQHTINDGLDINTCENNGGTVWSYNQGVILGGLSELTRATKDNSYTVTAKQIADAAIAALTDANGVLHDPCEPDCGADGVFARNLEILQKASPEARYASFLDTNANSIWETDRQGNELSVVWSGPYVAPANASTQSSAMDALIAALAT
ncbi:hypothetical protein B0A50_04867 [Salinomyces thailandicus]|uniref:Mannan endo-1,6-alpha-mannosidase n=1 Tax=Salinomyces thailandicus TaxID=706561 RepID=A0A4U0U0B6_9PEZI|nr:hypothetical protein B0A50_04867 [Salinomyces thailandica]